MKKIILFTLFIPLLFVSIYLGYTQMQAKKKNAGASKVTNMSVGINTNTLSNTQDAQVSTTSTPTSSPISVQAVSQINLTILSPESGIIVDSSSITVSGTTKAKISVVVNDSEITSSTDGTFKATVSLDEGENYISIVAYDEEGNVAEREIIVTRTTSDI